VAALSDDGDASSSTLAADVDVELGKKGKVGVMTGEGSAMVETKNA
jgi:hypothetical protein